MRDASAQASFAERLFLFIVLWGLWALTYFGLRLVPHATNVAPSWDPVWRTPYVSAFVIPYTAAYLLPTVLLFVPCDRGTFRRFCTAFALMMVISAPLFVLVPLVPPRVSHLGNGLLDRLLAAQYALDVDGNCFPSLHVSMSVLTALAIGHCVPRWRAPALGVALLIAVSTVFVHQHYVVDALAGIVLAHFVWRLSMHPSRASS